MYGTLLTEEQLKLKDRVRSFVEKEVIPVAQEYDEKGLFPWPIVNRAFEEGLMTGIVPKEYGGLGLDAVSLAIIAEELGRGCVGISTTIGGNNLCSYPVLIAGNPEQKRKYFDVLLQGKLPAFALTEPGAGSDAGAVATTAEKDGDYYVLNGSKCFCTNGEVASIFVVIASTDKSKGVKGLSAFIVEREREGLIIGKKENKMGIRSSVTNDLTLKNVRIPKKNLLGEEGQGFKIAMQTLDSGRAMVGAAAVGLAQAAFEEALDFAKKQTKGGKPLAKSQFVQFKLADMAIAVESARNAVLKTCVLKEQGKPFGFESAIAKTLSTDVAMKVSSEAVELMGSYGYSKNSRVEKLMRDAKVMQIYEGTNQIQRIVISNYLLRK
ncbi:MAG: hypothetical protein PWQ96_2087 [Clostridia bacterium]|nr:hypothetical protein [Clostridia bacterium]